MEMEKSKVSIHFLLIFRRFGDVLFFLYARRLCGYIAPERTVRNTLLVFFSANDNLYKFIGK